MLRPLAELFIPSAVHSAAVNTFFAICPLQYGSWCIPGSWSDRWRKSGYGETAIVGPPEGRLSSYL